ncbi:MAG: EF-P lysine aminoacylase EpmA [Patescibacteria group bacterium]
MGKNNNQLLEIQTKRALILDKIRQFFKSQGFLEVRTPSFVRLAGMEPYLNPLSFEFCNEKNKKYQGYVITSPEYSLKKLLALGFPKLFEIARVFRQGESFGPWHNPEFTMLEWYRPNSNYKKIMKDAENLVSFLAKALYKKPVIVYGGKKIDLSLPWPRLSVKQAFKKFAGIDLDKVKSFNAFKKIVKNKDYQTNKSFDWNDLFYLIFLNEIEPNLPQNKPIIIYDYPLPQAALAKRKNKNSFYAERFEIYIAGLEIANAFSELTDWREQEKRLKQEQKLRRQLGKEIYQIDKDFIAALKSGIPETGGIALGIERLEMLLLDIQDINELLPFPAKKLFE